MVTFEKTTVIDRAQEELFAFVADPANAHKWQSVVKSKQWTSGGPPGVGATQRVDARWLGLSVESTNEYTVWDPPNQARFKTSRGPLHIEEGMRLATEGKGTRLTWEMRIEGGGIFQLLEGLLKKQAEQTMVRDLEELKLLLEAGER